MHLFLRYLSSACSISLFLSTISLAQSASISGLISDAENGETLLLANVIVEGTQIGTASNNAGFYSLSGLPPGDYTLLFSYISYRTKKVEITLLSGKNLRLDVELFSESTNLDEVVVTSQAEKDEAKAIGTASLGTQLIKSLPALFEADVFRSVQLLPGVKSSNDFSSGLYIRGGSPDQTLILLDRTTVYNPSHFFGLFSTFNPDAIKDIRLYKGGYPAQYGGRLGSVVDIYNKDGNRNTFQGTATVGLLASRAQIEGPFQKGSYMVAFRRSTIEPVLAALQGTADNIPTKFFFLDLNAKVNVDANLKNRFSASFYGGQDVLTFPFADDASFDLRYGNRTFSLNWTHLFSNRLFSNFTLTSSRYFNFPSFEAAGTNFKRDNNVWDDSFKGDIEFIPNQNHTLSAGFWAGNMVLTIDDEFDNQATFRNRIHSVYSSAYVQEEFSPNPLWKITAGLRSNYFSEGEYFRLEPRASVEWKFNDQIRYQLAYGRYYQFLTLVSNDAFSAFDLWLTTGEGVPPSWGDQFVFGVKTRPTDMFNVDAEFYFRTMEDIFELDPRLPDAAGLQYQELFRFGEGFAYGTELTLEKVIGRLNGFVGYTFAVTKRRFPGFNPSRSDPAQFDFFPPRFDRTHDIKAVLNYRLSKKWKLTGAFTFASGQAFTRVTGQFSLVDNPLSNAPQDVIVADKLNAARLPSYHRLDLSFTRFGTLFSFPTELQLQVINVYNRQNVWFVNTDFEAGETPEQNNVNQLPILPTLSFTINFK